MPDFVRLSWQEKANCQNMPDLFFTNVSSGVEVCKKICDGCLVRLDCLDHSLRYSEYGVWGGMSEKERKLLKDKLVTPPQSVVGYLARRFRREHEAALQELSGLFPGPGDGEGRLSVFL